MILQLLERPINSCNALLFPLLVCKTGVVATKAALSNLRADYVEFLRGRYLSSVIGRSRCAARSDYFVDSGILRG